MLLAEVGQDGQEQLRKARVAVIGCGGLGTVVSDLLVRAGVGKVKIADRDRIELSNLQRQSLYNEDDIVQNLPKAVTAAAKLSRVNSQVIVEPVVIDINARNIEDIVNDTDLVIDGTDNYETRYLINDVCMKHNIPWIYASVAATFGMTMAIIPERTACLRCFCMDMPLTGSTPGTDTVGVWAPAVHVIASLQVSEAMKLLMGRWDDLHNRLIYVDVWSGIFEKFVVDRRIGNCPACGQKHYDHLEPPAFDQAGFSRTVDK